MNAPTLPHGLLQAGAIEVDVDELPLPMLREDLRLIDGGAGEDGRRLWKIHDPMSQRFYELGQDAVDLLSLWGGDTVGALRARIRARGGRDVPAQTVVALIEFLQAHELVQAMPETTFARVRQWQDARARRQTWLHSIVHGYLFFKVPLARPDRFLRRSVHCVGWCFRPGFWFAMGALALLSLYLVSRQWEAFLSTLPDMISVSGALTFFVSLALVKTLHELGHGYAAVRMGSRVTTMGVAFIVMMPILYTDTTDAWRLRTRRERVLIDAAGMAVELMVAVLATLFWVFLPDGAMRHAAFALATTGWVLSLAFNLNPLMRFDGYYLFSDLLRIPNLQERSFAMGRWFLRETLFGYGDEQPEPATANRRRFFVGFAFATWIYRFFLFLGIALLVYHFFFKLLGIALFAVELGWFVALPIWRELRVWLKRRKESGPRVRITALVALGALAAFVAPWPYMVRIPAILSAAQQQPSFAPRPARIDAILVAVGEQVAAGQVLMTLHAPEIEQALDSARDRARLLQDRLARRTADAQDLSESLVLARELRMEQDRIEGLVREKSRLVVKAPLDGVVMELTPELHAGRWVDATTRLALVGQPQSLMARGYVDGDELRRIAEGDAGRFVDEQRQMRPLDLQVSRIAAAASDTLDNWLLASIHGGPVASRADEKAARSEHAVFEVVAAVQASPGPLPITELRGEIEVRGSAESLALRVFRRIARVLIREGSA